MDSLVSTQWLAGELGSPNLAILDASNHLPVAGRDPRAEFVQAHIPGAKFLDLASLFDLDSPVPSALPTSDQFARRLADLGVAPDARVVLYDDSDVRTAARAWFIFRMHGVREVAILDGGLGKWRAEGRPVESGAHAPGGSADAPFSCAASGVGEVRTKEQMLANLATGAEQVLDAREAGRFTGELPDFRPEVAAGHIPSSRNLPYDRVLNADGTYKSPAELRRVFADAGVDLAAPVVTTCGGGVTAAVLLFAMHLIGKDDVALYDGSWSEWGADPVTPKELGAASLG
jgi:thiosulfate/3-mercaptopyruvate sulfurtransferase